MFVIAVEIYNLCYFLRGLNQAREAVTHSQQVEGTSEWFLREFHRLGCFGTSCTPSPLCSQSASRAQHSDIRKLHFTWMYMHIYSVTQLMERVSQACGLWLVHLRTSSAVCRCLRRTWRRCVCVVRFSIPFPLRARSTRSRPTYNTWHAAYSKNRPLSAQIFQILHTQKCCGLTWWFSGQCSHISWNEWARHRLWNKKGR